MVRFSAYFFTALLLCVPLSAAKPKKAEMMALLKKYSPEGYAVVSTYDTLPERFTIDGSSLNMKKNYDIMSFFPDGNRENFLQYVETGVHEINHLYTSWMAWKMLEDQGLELGKGADAIQVKGKPYLVIRTPAFPSAQIDATMPKAGKTDRYATYVSPSQSDQSTQSDGVYGLLDEFNAYRTGARTMLDLWPWVQEQEDTAPQITAYLGFLYDAKLSYLEFKLFILHYLVAAETEDPDVYEGLIGNKSFVKAFLAAEKEYAKIQGEIDARIEAIAEFCAGKDIETTDGGAMYMVGETGTGTSLKERKAIEKALAKPEYAAMMKKLAGK